MLNNIVSTYKMKRISCKFPKYPYLCIVFFRPGGAREKTVRTIQQNQHFRPEMRPGACLDRGKWYIISIF